MLTRALRKMTALILPTQEGEDIYGQISPSCPDYPDSQDVPPLLRQLHGSLRTALQTSADNEYVGKQLCQVIAAQDYDLQKKISTKAVQALPELNAALFGNGEFEAISMGLQLLAKYGLHLLETEKYPEWRTVQRSNSIFVNQLKPLKGYDDVLVSLGYSEITPESFRFPQSVASPDFDKVSTVTADLLILIEELKQYRDSTHVNRQRFEMNFSSGVPVDPVEDEEEEEEEDCCEVCGNTPQVKCIECTYFLCTECDEVSHPGARRMSHHRIPVDLKAVISGQVPKQEREIRASEVPSSTMAPPAPPSEELLVLPTSLSPTNPFRFDSPTEGMEHLRDGRSFERITESLQRLPPPMKLPVDSLPRHNVQPPSAPHHSYALAPPLLASGPLNQTNTKHRVKYDFNGENQEELTCKEGDELILLTEEENDGWWKMKNDGGETGLVPKSYMEEASAILSFGGPERRKTTPINRAGRRAPTKYNEQQKPRTHSQKSPITSYGKAFPVKPRKSGVQPSPLGAVASIDSRKEQKLQNPMKVTDEDSDDSIDVSLQKELLAKYLGRIQAKKISANDEVFEKLQEEGYDVTDSIEAAQQSGGSIEKARSFFKECCVCYEPTAMNKLIGLAYCQCLMCRVCFVGHFTELSQTKSCMYKYTCPGCNEPDLKSFAQSEFQDYFGLLGVLVKEHVSEQVNDLFQQKLVMWGLMKLDNFRWCVNGCQNGFLHEGRQLKVRCPQCRKYQCFKCNKPWKEQHEDVSCEEFDAWKKANDPELQALGLAAHLKENGISCPQCKKRYELARGGCMHFRCPLCQHQFCCGCDLPFANYPDCSVSESCKDKGLHAHHPRDCLYHLRDRDIETLQELLQMNGVDFTRADDAAGGVEQDACPVNLMVDSGEGTLKEQKCGAPPTGNTSLCETHYKEYLVGLINQNKLDPADVLSADQLRLTLERQETPVPVKQRKEKERNYHQRLKQLVKEQLPLRGGN